MNLYSVKYDEVPKGQVDPRPPGSEHCDVEVNVVAEDAEAAIADVRRRACAKDGDDPVERIVICEVAFLATVDHVAVVAPVELLERVSMIEARSRHASSAGIGGQNYENYLRSELGSVADAAAELVGLLKQ